MAIISATQVNATPRGNGEMYVTFQFALDTGDIVFDGPRFYPVESDLNIKAAEVGQVLLDALTAQEVDAWLSS